MSLKNILVALDTIASHSKKKDKEKLIESYCNTLGEDFINAVKYAYDPFKRYNTTGVDYVEENRGSVRLAYEYLDYLAGKRGCTNEEARELSSLASVDRETVEVIHRIVNKDLRCGCSEKTFVKFIPDIPIHDVMLAGKDIKAFVKHVGSFDNIISSMKMNGVRCWAIVEQDKSISYVSRSGLEYPNFSVFNDIILNKLNNIDLSNIEFPLIFDGEVISAVGKFRNLMSNIRKLNGLKPEIFRFFIFDAVLPNTNQLDRIKFVNNIFPIHSGNLQEIYDSEAPALVYSLYHDINPGFKCINDIFDYAKTVINLGNEGLVLKTKDNLYEYKRSSNWCKVKAMYISGQGIEVDLKVISWEYGTGRNKGRVGKLICDYNGVEVGVGTGFSDEERVDFMINTPKMIEVIANEETPDGSLLFPVFQRIRDDKEN
jgi:DNA ligase-1